VAPLTVNQLDRCNLLRRSIVCNETGKTSYRALLNFGVIQFNFCV
jgi:hypothetical protein